MIFGSLTGLARTTSKEDLLEMTFTERMYRTSGFNLEKRYKFCSPFIVLASSSTLVKSDS
jgi:hypothetical protein